MDTPDFWQKLDSLVEMCELIIDRPQGSAHPRYPDSVYPLDYGYLESTGSGNADGIDVWRGEGERHVAGIICTVDLEKRDTEIKVLLGCTHDEAEMLLAFHNSGLQGAILVERPPDNRPAGS